MYQMVKVYQKYKVIVILALMLGQSWASNLHKQICEQLKLAQPHPHQIPVYVPVQMGRQQLNTFKTECCRNHHNPDFHMIHHGMESPYYYSCAYYHSPKDQRRSPINYGNNSQQDRLVYTSNYIADNFNVNSCRNWVEYLYHPQIYKTKACQNPLCQRRYCPKAHQSQKKVQQKSNATVENNQEVLSQSIKEIKSIKNIQNLDKFENVELKNKIKQIQTKINAYADRLSKYDEQEAMKAIYIQNQIKTLANNSKDSNQSKSKWVNKDSNEGNYDVLFFMEQLKIVEDRTHEFKMFKEKDPKRIATLVLEYISAFLNSDGGSIYLGINDQSIVHGIQVSQKWLDQFKLYVDSDGRNDLSPPLIPQKYDLKIIPVNHPKKLDLKVIHIKVFPQSESQKKILTLFKKQCYLRMNASNHRLSASDIMEYMRLVNSKKVPSDSFEQIQQKIDSMTSSELKMLQQQVAKINTKIANAQKKKQRQNQSNQISVSEVQNS